MADYQRMYLRLFDAVERTLELMDTDPDPAHAALVGRALLIDGQQACEDIYVETEA